jgi:anaerobic magnesium-protoporphyrin IX monomethyl ester cyclase
MPAVERKSAKVTLVNPPSHSKSFLHPQFPLIGLAYMAAALEKSGHEVTAIDCPARGMTHEGLKQEIARLEPDIVGITSMTVTFPAAVEAACIIKQSCPTALVVLGGPHATVRDEQTLNEQKEVDVVVRGEGEQTMLELAHHVSNPKKMSLNKVAGITFRKNGQVVRTPDRPFIQNLDEIPRPAYEYFELSKYRYFGKLTLPIMASRGCPFQCAYCLASKMSGKHVRTRSTKNVVDELEWLKDVHGADAVTFHDPTFTLDRDRTRDLCEEMKRRHIDLPWDCSTRVDQVSKKILAKMRAAKCQTVGLGVESNSQKILNAMKKGTTVEQNERAVKWAKEVGLSFGLFLIIGYPGETVDTLKESLDFVRRTEPDDVFISFATPYPSTEFYDRVKEMGWKMSTDWSRHDNVTPVFENPLLPAEKMIETRRSFYNQYYSPSYILRQSLKKDLYGRAMARTAMNHMLWRIKLPAWVSASFKKLTVR